MKKGMMLFWAGLVVLVILGIGASFYSSRQPGKLDSFAQCLKDSGAVFYGAWWCPHCQNTKRMFGKSARLLPYLECSTADGKDQLQVCKDKNIESYPTWEFTDGERLTGERTLQELSQKTGCVLP